MIKTSLRELILGACCPECRKKIEGDVRTLDRYNTSHLQMLARATARLKKARAKLKEKE